MTPVARSVLVAAVVLSVGGLAAALVALLGKGAGGGSAADRAHTSLQGAATTTMTTAAIQTVATTAHSVTVASTQTRSRAVTTTRASVTTSHTSQSTQSTRSVTVVSVNDSAELHLLHSNGNTLVEEGKATGTLRGRVLVTLDINAAQNTATATYTLHRPGGTLSGHSRGRSEGGHGGREAFSGSMSIDGGTGEYAGASGSGSLSGVVYRRNDSVTVHQEGSLRY